MNIENDIVNEYDRGATIKDIRIKYKKANASITKILKKYNVQIRNRFDYVRKFTNEEEGSICSDYLAGISTPLLCKKYACNVEYIREVLIRGDIKRRPLSDAIRKYKFLDEHFFDQIDTEAKAYFLGLLWTDGCNYIRIKNKNNHINWIVISLQERDKHILETFCNFIYGNSLVLRKKVTKKDCNRQDQWGLRIPSRHISEKLLSYGMSPRKSFVVNMPSCHIPDNLFHHFIRGCWDGDGSIYFNTNSNHYGCSFIGSVPMVNSMCKYLLEKIGIKFSIENLKQYSQPMATIKIHSNNISKKFLTWLYKDSTIYLNRKHELYQKIIST